MDSLTVKDWMKRNVVGITKEETIADAAKLMTEKEIGVLVIFDRKEDSLFHKRKMCGLITDSDIIRRVIAQNNDIHAPLEQFMATDLITASPDDTLQTIGNKLIENNIKRVVITEGEHATAIVSITDFINWLASETGRAREVISEEITEILKKRYGDSDVPIADEFTNASTWMTHKVMTIDATATVFQAADMIARNYIGALPVKSEAGLVGIVTITDILRRLVALEKDPNSTPVQNIMSTPVVYVSPTSTLLEVLDLLSSRKIKHVPVVDAENGLVGIISHRDIIRVILRIGMSHYLSKLSMEQ